MGFKNLISLCLVWSLCILQISPVYGQIVRNDDLSTQHEAEMVDIPELESIGDRSETGAENIDNDFAGNVTDGDNPDLPDHWRTQKTEDNSVLSAITLFISAFLMAKIIKCKKKAASAKVAMVAGIVYLAMEIIASQKLESVTAVDIEIVNRENAFVTEGQQEGLFRLRKQYSDYKEAITQRKNAQLIGFIAFQVAAGIAYVEAIKRKSSGQAAQGAAASGQSAASASCATGGGG